MKNAEVDLAHEDSISQQLKRIVVRKLSASLFRDVFCAWHYAVGVMMTRQIAYNLEEFFDNNYHD